VTVVGVQVWDRSRIGPPQDPIRVRGGYLGASKRYFFSRTPQARTRATAVSRTLTMPAECKDRAEAFEATSWPPCVPIRTGSLSSAAHCPVPLIVQCRALSSAAHCPVPRIVQCRSLSSAAHCPVPRIVQCRSLSNAIDLRRPNDRAERRPSDAPRPCPGRRLQRRLASGSRTAAPARDGVLQEPRVALRALGPLRPLPDSFARICGCTSGRRKSPSRRGCQGVFAGPCRSSNHAFAFARSLFGFRPDNGYVNGLRIAERVFVSAQRRLSDSPSLAWRVV